MKFLQHRTAATIFMVGIWIIGIMSFLKMPMQVFPSTPENTVMVDAALSQMSVSDIEDSIARPLERQARGLTGVDNVITQTSEGFFSAYVSFSESVSSETALSEINQIANAILPANIDKKVSYYENSDLVANIAVAFDTDRIDYNVISRFISELSDFGVTKANLVGIPEQNIFIQLDPISLQRYGLTHDSVINQISEQLVSGTAGAVGKGAQRVFLEFEKKVRLDSIHRVLSSLVIVTPNKKNLSLLEIGSIEYFDDETSYRAYLNGERIFEIEIMRSEGQSLSDIQQKMHDWKSWTFIPDGVTVEIFDEEWKNIQERMDMMFSSGIGGLVLVLAILFLTLNRSMAIWVAAGIPTAFAASFFILNMLGVSLNILTVFGLIMSLGIIIDDAVLIAEKALKEMTSGLSRQEAIQSAIKKMSVPLIASSLTTVAAFIPLVSISGPLGGMIEIIPIVMVCVITASLIEVFVILPAHLNKANIISAKGDGEKAWVKQVESWFLSSVVFALKRKYLVIFCSLVSVVGIAVIPAMGLINFTFSPETQSNFSVLSVEFKADSTKAQQRAFLSRVESDYMALATNYPDKPIQIATYEGKGEPLGSFDINQVDHNKGRLVVFYQPKEVNDAGMSDDDWINAFIESIELPSYVQGFDNAYADSEGRSYDLTVALQAEDSDALLLSSDDFMARVQDMEGVASIERLNTKEVAVYDIKLKPEARNFGLTENDVKEALQIILQPNKIAGIHEGVFTHDVIVSVGKKESYRTLPPQDVPILLDGRMVRLGDVATVSVVNRDSNITRINGIRTSEFGVMLTPDAQVGPYELYDTIEENIIPVMKASYPVMFGLSGQSQQEAKTMSDMLNQSVIALVLIYIILSLAFSSYSKPLLIMSIIPFSVMGAILGHYIMGYDFSALSVLSIFGLSGIVVNNTIAIMHEYNLRLVEIDDKGLAMSLALKNRFRAIFVTTITTVAGLLPLLITQEMAADYLKPMAVSIVFGLLFTMFMVCYTFPAAMMVGNRTKKLKDAVDDYNDFLLKKNAILMRIEGQSNISKDKIEKVRCMTYKNKLKISLIHQRFKLA